MPGAVPAATGFVLKARVMESDDVKRALTRVAHEIVERNKGTDDLVIVGIRTRGAPLADRIAAEIASFEGVDLPSGALDVTLYRERRSQGAPQSRGHHRSGRPRWAGGRSGR